MKPFVAIFALTILPSCGFFHNVHPDVVAGQRMAYAGVQNLEANYEVMITELETQQKLLIAYVHNYAYQVNLDIYKRDHPIISGKWNEDEDAKAAREEQNRENQIAVEQKRIELTEKRDNDIARDHAKVDSNMKRWRDVGAKGHNAVKQLLEAVYNNISETPISVDNITSIIEKTNELWKKIDEEIN